MVDASIMPTIVGATSSMTVYAVAEKVSCSFLLGGCVILRPWTKLLTVDDKIGCGSDQGLATSRL